MVTREDVRRQRIEKHAALDAEISDCPECGQLVGDDHLGWCDSYDAPSDVSSDADVGGSGSTAGSSD